MSERRPRGELADYAQRLHARGWVANHDGNVTVRDGQGRYLATPTATSKAAVRADGLVVVDDAGKQARRARQAVLRDRPAPDGLRQPPRRQRGHPRASADGDRLRSRGRAARRRRSSPRRWSRSGRRADGAVRRAGRRRLPRARPVHAGPRRGAARRPRRARPGGPISRRPTCAWSSSSIWHASRWWRASSAACGRCRRRCCRSCSRRAPRPASAAGGLDRAGSGERSAAEPEEAWSSPARRRRPGSDVEVYEPKRAQRRRAPLACRPRRHHSPGDRGRAQETMNPATARLAAAGTLMTKSPREQGWGPRRLCLRARGGTPVGSSQAAHGRVAGGVAASSSGRVETPAGYACARR